MSLLLLTNQKQEHRFTFALMITTQAQALPKHILLKEPSSAGNRGGIIQETSNCASWAVRHYFKLIPVRYPDSPQSLEGRIHSLIPSALLRSPTHCEVLSLWQSPPFFFFPIKGDNEERKGPEVELKSPVGSSKFLSEDYNKRWSWFNSRHQNKLFKRKRKTAKLSELHSLARLNN